MSRCFTKDYKYVTLMNRELQLCHAVLQRIKGMSRYVTSWYFSLKCCSSCCRRLLFNWSSSCRSCISFNLALRSDTAKQTSGTTLLIHIFSWRNSRRLQQQLKPPPVIVFKPVNTAETFVLKTNEVGHCKSWDIARSKRKKPTLQIPIRPGNESHSIVSCAVKRHPH